jgi:myosin-5
MFQKLGPMLKGSILEGSVLSPSSAATPTLGDDMDDLNEEPGNTIASTHYILQSLRHFLRILQESKVSETVIIYLMSQIMHFIDCSLFNEILLRKDLCSYAKGMEMKNNIAQLDDEVSQWLGTEIQLSYVRQAATLLMMKKNLIQQEEIRRNSIPNLTFPQISKLLQMFTRAEFEDPITIDTFHFLAKQSNNPLNEKTLFLTTKEISPIDNVEVLRHAEVDGQLHFLSFPISIRDAIEERYQEEQKLLKEAQEKERLEKELKEKIKQEEERLKNTPPPVASRKSGFFGRK